MRSKLKVKQGLVNLEDYPLCPLCKTQIVQKKCKCLTWKPIPEQETPKEGTDLFYMRKYRLSRLEWEGVKNLLKGDRR